MLFRLAAFSVATCVALVLGEVAVRAFCPQVMFPRYVTDGGFGIRVNVSGARYWHTSPEMRVQFRINTMGIRSDIEYTLEKPPQTLRIVGLGDSFTQGYEVDVRDTYLYRLAEILTAKGFRVQVINLGVSGHGNAEELIMLTEFGFRFDPDVVVLGYYQNDPLDNVRSNLYALDEQDRLVRAADAYLPAVGIRDTLYSFWAYRWLAERSQLFALAREGLANVVKRKMVKANTAKRGASTDDVYPDRLAAQLLDKIKHECLQRNVAFVLLDIPDHRSLASNLPLAFFKEITSEEIIRTGPRLRAEGTGAYLYRRHGHRHWTPRSHEIAAEMLAEMLVPRLKAIQARWRTSRPVPQTGSRLDTSK